MKKAIFFIAAACLLLIGLQTRAQGDKSKRTSPPASVKKTLASGATISINYSQPSLKGRVIGKDVEPKEGQIWRTGANEATVFETDKDILVEGKTLPAGKYALFTIAGKDSWTIIFSKKWKQWGAFEYKESDDALRVTVKPGKADVYTEKLSFVIDLNGGIEYTSFIWGDLKISFSVK
jgi:hypothetical protein